MSIHSSSQARGVLVGALAVSVVLAGCGGDHKDNGSDGPVSAEAPVIHLTGNNVNGQQVFRFETFGNERFWTDALRLQQGVIATGVTPIKALQLGLMVDSQALDAATDPCRDHGGNQDRSVAGETHRC